MLWFRWYNGTVGDAKFEAIARKTGVHKAIVLTTWAAIMESANQNEPRGTFSQKVDELSVQVCTEVEVIEKVLKEFRAKGMVRRNTIVKFQARNPKRDDSADRVRKYRAKRNADETHVTRDVTPVTRLDKRRVDESRTDTDTITNVIDAGASPGFPHRRGKGAITNGQIMKLIRERFYAPDGKPPSDFDEDREMSILLALKSKGKKGDEIASAIEGLALIRDDNGRVGDGELEWIKRSDKLTLRALYDTANGVRPVWQLALQKLSESTKRNGSAMPSVADVMRAAGEDRA